MWAAVIFIAARSIWEFHDGIHKRMLISDHDLCMIRSDNAIGQSAFQIYCKFIYAKINSQNAK